MMYVCAYSILKNLSYILQKGHYKEFWLIVCEDVCMTTVTPHNSSKFMTHIQNILYM